MGEVTEPHRPKTSNALVVEMPLVREWIPLTQWKSCKHFRL